MAQMLLLNHIRAFLRKHPAYEPDMVELSAAIHILSCKQVGVKNNLGTTTNCEYKQSRANNKHNAGQ